MDLLQDSHRVAIKKYKAKGGGGGEGREDSGTFCLLIKSNVNKHWHREFNKNWIAVTS